MSFYPVIKTKNVNFNKITLSEPQKFITEHPNMKCSFESYDINYEYDRIGCDKLHIVTDFLNLERPQHYGYSDMVEKTDGKISFVLSNNDNFENFLQSLVTEIESKITQSHKENYVLKNSVNKNNKPLVLLNQFNGKITTQIYHHKSKKDGGNIVTISNVPIHKFIDDLYKEMKLFKSKSYGKEITPLENNSKEQIINNEEKLNETEKKPKIKLLYSGKFIINIKCQFIKYENINKGKVVNTEHKLKIFLYVKECETKFSSSKVKSVLDIDTTTLITRNTKQPTTLIL